MYSCVCTLNSCMDKNSIWLLDFFPVFSRVFFLIFNLYTKYLVSVACTAITNDFGISCHSLVIFGFVNINFSGTLVVVIVSFSYIIDI